MLSDKIFLKIAFDSLIKSIYIPMAYETKVSQYFNLHHLCHFHIDDAERGRNIIRSRCLCLAGS
jgi:hypothetical protein